MVDKVLEHVMPQSDPGASMSLLRTPPWVAPFPYNELYDPRLLGSFNRPHHRDRGESTSVLAAMLKNRTIALPTTKNGQTTR